MGWIMSRDKREADSAAVDRRNFLTGAAALGAAVGTLASSNASAEVRFPTQPGKFGSGGAAGTPGSVFGGQANRSENTLYDCEVDGKLPDDLDGAFYRVGTMTSPSMGKAMHRCSASRTDTWIISAAG